MFSIFIEQKLKNPFLIAGYNSLAYFCDRESETEAIAFMTVFFLCG